MKEFQKLFWYWPLLLIGAVFYGCYALFGRNGILFDLLLIVLFIIYWVITNRQINKRIEGMASIGGRTCDCCDKRVTDAALQARTAIEIRMAVERGWRPPESIYRSAVSLGQTREPRRKWEATWCQQAMATSDRWALCPYCASQVDRLTSKKFWQFWK